MTRERGTILLLQGPPCRFWPALADGLEAAGRRVVHVGFHLGDVAMWRRRGQRLYRGARADWPAWLADLVACERVSDVLYYADCLPYHRAAREVARSLDLRAWAIENGYLRPDWLTMEPEGMGAASRFARDPARLRALAASADPTELTPRYRHGFLSEAVSEVGYHLAMVAGRPLFPHYCDDKWYPPVLDYLSWLRRWGLGGPARRAARDIDRRCAAGGWPFHLLALQLQSDYQIRASSPYACLSEMLEQVVASFAASAPPAQRLVVKLHPMDNGWENWPGRAAGIAARHGVAARVVAIDGGRLDRLLDAASGVITVNSTVGLHALRAGCPTLALGDAVYRVPGLTHGSGLDRFWSAPERPDPSLVRDLCTALASEIQVRGSFYDPAGRRAAIAEITRRLAVPERYWRLHRGDPTEKRAPASGTRIAAE